jgi:hypothetical protein
MDLKAYALGEGTQAERAAVAAHLAGSAEARQELQQLELTLSALHALPDVEIPRRIAFVSDPVFAPTWWQRFWQPGPQALLGAAAMLALAIGGHGWMMRPLAPPPIAAARQDAVGPEQLKQVVNQAVDEAVGRALAQSEARQQLAVKLALSEAEKRHQRERQMMAVSFEENLGLLRKQMNRLYVSAANLSVADVRP